MCCMLLIRTLTHTSTLLLRTMTSQVEQAKDAAALRAVREHVYDGCRLGVGSGSTVVYAVKHLAELVTTAGLNVTCVPTSFQVYTMVHFIDESFSFSDFKSD